MKTNRYARDDTVHPNEHLHILEEICGLLKIDGLSHEEVKRKLFPLSLESEAFKCYRSLDNPYGMKFEDLHSEFL